MSKPRLLLMKQILFPILATILSLTSLGRVKLKIVARVNAQPMGDRYDE